ncbi:hypothetical protein [Bauldia litoralis]|nr:hypothetical protein [Bauldia litoralis]
MSAMIRRIFALAFIAVFTLALSGHAPLSALKKAAAGADIVYDQASDTTDPVVISRVGCGSGTGSCSFEAVTPHPAPLHPRTRLASVSWLTTGAKLSRIPFGPDLRPPIPAS